MSLRIRLARGGAKKRPFYRIVVADSRSPRDGRFIEKIGTYNPMLAKDHPNRVRLNEERAKHWLSVGARASDRVTRFLAAAELTDARQVPEQTKKSKPKAKALEREAARAEKAAGAAAEAAEPAEETAAPEAEAAAPEAEAAAPEAEAAAPEEEAAAPEEAAKKEEASA